MVQFNLANNIYATQFEEAVIILDVTNDKYISLIGDAAQAFLCILNGMYVCQSDGTYIPNSENSSPPIEATKWILEFKAQGFVVEHSDAAEKNILSIARKGGGLREYQWDTKINWRPFSQTSCFHVLAAYKTLWQVHWLIKKRGMLGLFELIKKQKLRPQRKAGDITLLIASVDCATKLYPKKTYCLAWAATFVVQALKHGIPCHLTIGIQTNPFYAHAWAELEDGAVVNDDPQVAEVLSIIAKISGKY